MTPTGRDAEATKNAIIDAAEAVFLENGFSKATTSAIAERARVTKSLLHHHFGSKDGLWSEVKRRRFDIYAKEQARMLDEQVPTLDLLRRSIVTFFKVLKENPELVRIMAWMYLERDRDPCMAVEEELSERGVALLKEAQERGLLRHDVNPSSILFTFIGMIHHWFQDRDHYCRKFGTRGLTDDQLDELFLADFQKILLEGILPR